MVTEGCAHFVRTWGANLIKTDHLEDIPKAKQEMENARKPLEIRDLRAFRVSGAVGTRTRDQRIKSPLLYLLSYSP